MGVIAVAGLSLCLGAAALTPVELARGLAGVIRGTPDTAGLILLHVRLPRLAAAVLAGTGLALSGAIIQTLLMNPLASPGILGVNAGAAFAVALCSAIAPHAVYLPQSAAFAGAMLTMLVVSALASKAGVSRMTLILVGVALSSLFTAGVRVVTLLVPDALRGVNAFEIGGLAGVSLKMVSAAAPIIIGSTFIIIMLAKPLDVMSLGGEAAAELGMRVGIWRMLFLALAAALAGSAVSIAGLLGFVGLVVPHIARMLARGSRRRMLILSAQIGAGLLTLCDTAARTLFAPYELPVGIIVAFLGVPFFLWILFTKARRADD
ncbi:corrinoid ABC transporter permease [Clostridia bacterium]|nr:corrinoid ABC transporter permease [Clostridia bacterium]